MIRQMLNTLVRAYLRHSPLTDGKKQLLALTRRAILPDGGAVTFRTKQGFRMTVNLRNPEHQHLYFYGEHDERYEVNNLERILRPGDTCWDIGGNIGFFTCFFASRVGPGGRVVTFEPIRATADLLEANVRLNGFANVLVKRLALGDAAGRQEVFLDHPDLAQGTVSLTTAAGAHRETIDIESIDRVAATLPVPDFVKIDVEGYQVKVLRGGREFLARHGPMIMAELRDRDPALMAEAQDLLRAQGYEIYGFHKRSLVLCKDIRASRGRNFLMVRPQGPHFARILSRVR